MARQSIRERFPSTWRVVEIPGGFAVADSAGAMLVYVYAPEVSARTAIANRTLTRGEARSIATAITRLPYLEQV